MIRQAIFRIGVFGKIILWLGVWHGVYFFLKKPKRLLWLVFTAPFWVSAIGFCIEYYFAEQENEVMSSPATAIHANVATNIDPNAPVNVNDPKYIMQKSSNVAYLPKFVGKIEDGTSAFNVNIAATMDSNDHNYYASHFRYAMNYFPANQKYKWLMNSHFYGYFEAKDKFKAQSGAVCREFSEIVHYNGKNQRFSGYACSRGDGGWCKLRYKSSLSCKIGTSSPTSIFWRNMFNSVF